MDSATRSFQIFSNSLSQVGTHRYVIKGALDEYTNNYATTTLDVFVNNPCPATTLISPQALSDMSTSVLVGTVVTQQVGVIKDKLSVDQGYPSGT